MKKRIYLDKIKYKYEGNEKDYKYEEIKSQNGKVSFSDKVLLVFKTFGLILLLLLGPSLFVSIFGSGFQNFPLTIKVIISLISNLIIMGILIFIYRNTFINDFKKFFNRNIGENLELSFKYWFLGFLIMIVSNLIITFITGGGIASNEEAVREMIDMAPIYMIFDVAIYAPITEELIFRKSIRDFCSNKWIYILISGLVFGGLHIVGSTDSPIDWLFLIPYCSLGIAFAALYRKSNNIFSSISMHCLHNTIAIVTYLYSMSIVRCFM